MADCPPGYYRSAIVARADAHCDLLRTDFTLALNDPLSQSGWGAPWAAGYHGVRRVVTGSHAASARGVIDGAADAAAIDALTWFFLKRDESWTSGLKVLTWTKPTPTLPYITALGRHATPIRLALASAIADIGPQDQESLQLYGLIDIALSTYSSLPIPDAA